MNETNVRFTVVFAAILLHLIIIIFVAFEVDTVIQEKALESRVIRLLDLDEILPEPVRPQVQPPPPPLRQRQEPDIPQVEAIAEIMIETETVPEQEIVEAGALREHVEVVHAVSSAEQTERIFTAAQVRTTPQFDEASLAADLTYPAIALRSGIEGRVILNLLVDRAGAVQRIDVLLEDPPERGFGEAAVRVFTGRKGTPAYDANGEPVSCVIRRPVLFRIK